MSSSISDFIKKYTFILFLLISILISWFPWYTGGSGFLVFGPSIAGVLVIALTRGKDGMRELGKRALKWRVRIRWWIIALFISGAIILVAIPISLGLGGALPSFAFFKDAWYMIPVYFMLTLLGGPLGEEFGWRGFALPYLQDKHKPIVASVIIGTVWALWHLPLFFQQGSIHNQMGLKLLPIFILGEIVLAIIMSWVYNQTGSSLLVGGIILHNADNFWASTLITDETMASAFQGGIQSQFNTLLYIVSTIVGLLLVVIIAAKTKGALGFAPNSQDK